MEAVRNQLRSGLTWAPQNNSRWCQGAEIESPPTEGAFKPKIVSRRAQQAAPVAPTAPTPRDAFREILEKFQD